MGDVVREEAKRRGLPITDAAVGGMAHTERDLHGFGIWAERTLPRIHGDRVVVDGLRGRAELEVFRKALERPRSSPHHPSASVAAGARVASSAKHGPRRPRGPLRTPFGTPRAPD